MIEDKKIKKVQSIDDLIAFNKKVIEIGKKLNKIVVATGDVHFLYKRDSVFRTILMHSKDFADAFNQPPVFYRNTKEMLSTRLSRGMEYAKYNLFTKENFKEKFADILKNLVNENLIKKSNTHLILTQKGMDLQNSILLKFMD